ncbi:MULTISPECIES: hypothetical protein [Chitinibacter]|uniref:hypothetical protein n=1 Tax=Chitinibacter TaxID=230666 RepID=UPI00041F1644|nr:MULTISPECIES: hypothetical protein [Chitinibacter]
MLTRLALFCAAACLSSNLLACDLSLQTPANISVSVDNMRHGLKNELTLFLTVKAAAGHDFKRPPIVVDANGRVSEPIRMEGALGAIQANETRQWVVYYTPVADFTADKVVVQ